MCNSIWSTLCWRFKKHLTQVDCEFHVDRLFWYFKMKYLPLGNKPTLKKKKITHRRKCIRNSYPSVRHFSKIFHRGCLDLKWSSPNVLDKLLLVELNCAARILFGIATTSYMWLKNRLWYRIIELFCKEHPRMYVTKQIYRECKMVPVSIVS